VSRRATSRPPKLDDPKPAGRARREPRRPNARAQVMKARLAGRHDRLGRVELHSVMRRVVGGDRAALLGLDRFPGADVPELQHVLTDVWGCDPDASTLTIDPDRLLGGLAEGTRRLRDVARRGGRVLLATGRPASLLPVHQALGRLARAHGAHVLEAGEAGPIAAAGRAALRAWWVGGVAALTDGDALLADLGLDALDEILFSVPHPDLVVADLGFAGGAVRAGIEVVALADLDALALGLAATRGLPITVVPMHGRRPAAAYSVLEGLVTAPVPAPAPEPAREPAPEREDPPEPT
jgi:hypothetical protein